VSSIVLAVYGDARILTRTKKHAVRACSGTN
jgi:hypothetical protein